MKPTTAAHFRRKLVTAGALAASAAIAVPALAAPTGSFKGKTSKNGNVTFKVVGKKVKKFKFTYEAPCSDDSKLTGYFTFIPLEVKGKRFGEMGTSSGKLDDGRETVSNLRVTGRFKTDRKAAGTVSISTELQNANRDGLITCKTGKLTYRARRK